jgi:hypothetical protein
MAFFPSRTSEASLSAHQECRRSSLTIRRLEERERSHSKTKLQNNSMNFKKFIELFYIYIYIYIFNSIQIYSNNSIDISYAYIYI